MCELTARHDRGTAWARHAMCESALTVLLSLHFESQSDCKNLNGDLFLRQK